MRPMQQLQLQAECNIASVSGGGFHQLSIDTGIIPLPERIEISEAECDVDALKKLKLGLRSTLWSRPASATSQMDRLPHQIQDHHQQQQQLKHQQQQPPHQRQQNSPSPLQKLLSEKSDYSISV